MSEAAAAAADIINDTGIISDENKSDTDNLSNASVEDSISQSSTTCTQRKVDTLGDALNRACEQGQLNVVVWLVEHSVLRDDIWAMSGALTSACFNNRLNVVTWLIVNNTILHDDWEALNSALRVACESGQLNVVTWLLEHTILRTEVTVLENAMVWAAAENQWKVMKLLLENKQADVNCIDHTNNTVLHYAIRSGGLLDNLVTKDTIIRNMQKLCERAFMCGDDVNVQNLYGETPLHKACRFSISDIVGALLLAGADRTITNEWGHTPMQVAESGRDLKVLELMDVSSGWKMLLCTHRLRRRTAVRVMMTLWPSGRYSSDEQHVDTSHKARSLADRL